MVISMTGFGRSKIEAGSFSVNVEVKTVNHRFCEINIRMPKQLFIMEDKIKKKLTQYIRRGRVEVYISLEGGGTVTRRLQADWKLLDDYWQFLNQVREKYNVESKVSLQDLVSLNELLHIEESEVENQQVEDMILKAVEQSVTFLKQMRLAEGEALKNDLLASLAKIEGSLNELQVYSPQVVQSYKERLTKRMMEFVGGHIDETRILTEAAIFADKVDINEELTRLRSHIRQFIQTLNESEPMGRKLDFLVQEMNREANTIGSKANDSNIAGKTVEVKSLLEKVKEQVQNIE